MDEIGPDRYARTVVADALITCSEFFQVKDERTGALVQGTKCSNHRITSRSTRVPIRDHLPDTFRFLSELKKIEYI